MNHTHFPKEDHLPYWARRDNKFTKGDRVDLGMRSKHTHWKKKKTHSLWDVLLNFNTNLSQISSTYHLLSDKELSLYNYIDIPTDTDGTLL